MPVNCFRFHVNEQKVRGGKKYWRFFAEMLYLIVEQCNQSLTKAGAAPAPPLISLLEPPPCHIQNNRYE